MVVITPRLATPNNGNRYPLRGLKVEYKNPFDSVAEGDWSAMQ